MSTWADVTTKNIDSSPREIEPVETGDEPQQSRNTNQAYPQRQFIDLEISNGTELFYSLSPGREHQAVIKYENSSNNSNMIEQGGLVSFESVVSNIGHSLHSGSMKTHEVEDHVQLKVTNIVDNQNITIKDTKDHDERTLTASETYGGIKDVYMEEGIIYSKNVDKTAVTNKVSGTYSTTSRNENNIVIKCDKTNTNLQMLSIENVFNKNNIMAISKNPKDRKLDLNIEEQTSSLVPASNYYEPHISASTDPLRYDGKRIEKPPKTPDALPQWAVNQCTEKPSVLPFGTPALPRAGCGITAAKFNYVAENPGLERASLVNSEITSLSPLVEDEASSTGEVFEETPESPFTGALSRKRAVDSGLSLEIDQESTEATDLPSMTANNDIGSEVIGLKDKIETMEDVISKLMQKITELESGQKKAKKFHTFSNETGNTGGMGIDTHSTTDSLLHSGKLSQQKPSSQKRVNDILTENEPIKLINTVKLVPQCTLSPMSENNKRLNNYSVSIQPMDGSDLSKIENDPMRNVVKSKQRCSNERFIQRKPKSPLFTNPPSSPNNVFFNQDSRGQKKNKFQNKVLQYSPTDGVMDWTNDNKKSHSNRKANKNNGTKNNNNIGARMHNDNNTRGKDYDKLLQPINGAGKAVQPQKTGHINEETNMLTNKQLQTDPSPPWDVYDVMTRRFKIYENSKISETAFTDETNTIEKATDVKELTTNEIQLEKKISMRDGSLELGMSNVSTNTGGTHEACDVDTKLQQYGKIADNNLVVNNSISTIIHSIGRINSSDNIVDDSDDKLVESVGRLINNSSNENFKSENNDNYLTNFAVRSKCSDDEDSDVADANYVNKNNNSCNSDTSRLTRKSTSSGGTPFFGPQTVISGKPRNVSIAAYNGRGSYDKALSRKSPWTSVWTNSQLHYPRPEQEFYNQKRESRSSFKFPGGVWGNSEDTWRQTPGSERMVTSSPGSPRCWKRQRSTLDMSNLFGNPVNRIQLGRQGNVEFNHSSSPTHRSQRCVFGTAEPARGGLQSRRTGFDSAPGDSDEVSINANCTEITRRISHSSWESSNAGSSSPNQVNSLIGVPRRRKIFVGQIDKTVTPEMLKEYMERKGALVHHIQECTPKTIDTDREYFRNFKVTVENPNIKQLLDSSFWPKHVYCQINNA